MHSRRSADGGDSRDGKRVYFTKLALLSVGRADLSRRLKSWMVKLDVDPKGGMKLDEKFFVESTDCEHTRFGWMGGDASSDSYCYSDAK